MHSSQRIEIRRQAHFSLLRDTRDLLVLADIKRDGYAASVKPALEQQYVAPVASRLEATSAGAYWRSLIKRR
jgi:hypothetical protein